MASPKTGVAKLMLDLRSSGPLQLGTIIGVLLTSLPAMFVLYILHG